MSIIKPKPRRERLRLEAIIFDPRLQLRAYPGDQWFDDAYVRTLSDLYEGGTEFEPLDVVEEDRGKKREPAYWLFDGFNRSECYRRAGAGLIEVNVYRGTFADAQLWALASNARHGRARTSEDCRKAFDRLLSSAVMMDRVVQDRGRFQGTERALAAACGLSHGAVGKYLRERNLRVDRLSGKLIPADGPVSPERDARQALVDELTALGKSQKAIAADLGVDAVTVRKDQRRARTTVAVSNLARAGENPDPEPAPEPTVPAPSVKAEPEPAPTEPTGGGNLPQPVENAPAPLAPVSPRKAAAVARVLENPLASAEDTVEEVVKQLASVAGKVDGLTRGPLRDRLERIARVNGAPLEFAEVDALPLIPRAGDSLKKTVRAWPALQKLQAIFAQLVAEVATAEFDRERD